MCGSRDILARPPLEIALDTLKRLEYRGYDSAGVAFWGGEKLQVMKRAGKIQQLSDLLNGVEAHGLAVSHTRWATHGIPNDPNAHPHTDEQGRVAVVHNGIIENYPNSSRSCSRAGISSARRPTRRYWRT